MTVQAKTGPVNPFGFLSYSLNAINNALHQVVDVVKSPFEMIKVAVDEHEQLQDEVHELTLKLQNFHEVREENKRLKSLLGLKDAQPSYVASAVLINKGADHWFKTVIINKGSNDGIQKDMIAIVPGGLAGKIIREWPSYSEMLLVTDSSYSVSVRLQDSRMEGILTGTGSDYCVLNYVSNDVDVKEGDVVVTSGLDTFTPKGIPVGIVRNVRKTTPELFQYLEVDPFIEISRFEEVTVIRR